MKGLDKPFVAREENKFFGKGKLKGVDAERNRCWEGHGAPWKAILKYVSLLFRVAWI